MKRVLLILYLIVGFIPNFEASDKSSTQVLYLSIVNLISVLFILINPNRLKLFLNSLKENLIFISLFLFSVWGLFTSFFSINQSESFRVLTTVVVFVIASSTIYFILKEEKFNFSSFILKTIPVLLILEILTIIIPFFIDLNTDSIVNRSSNYSGITGNINIAAFSIVCKIPFLWRILFNNHTKILIKIICSILNFIAVFVIVYIHQTRGAILALLLINILTLGYLIFTNKKYSKPNFYLNILHIIIPILSIFLLNTISKNELTTNVNERLKSITELQDSSSSERFRYYKQALSSIAENPITGVGIGNWSLEAIKLDIENISQYIVAYHVHNDFLEIFAETGVLGFILFFGVIFYFLLKLFNNFFKNQSETIFFISISILAYLMDSFLNFPFSRPIQLMQLLVSMSLAQNILIPDITNNFKINQTKIALILILILSPITIYSANRIFESNKDQWYLLGQFNSNQFVQPIDEVVSYEDKFPELSGTTIPLSTFKGIFLTANSKFNEAIPYYRRGMKSNPYLKISESYLGWNYFNLKQYDSAYYYTKKAFEYHPNNTAHYTYYMATLTALGDSTGIRNTYEKMKSISSLEIVDNVYFVASAGTLDKSSSKELINKANQSLLKQKDDNTIKGIYILNFGQENTMKGYEAHNIGLYYFEKEEFIKAAEYFELATEYNNLEIPYFENAANAYMKIENYEKSLKFLDYVLKDLDSLRPKSHYLKGLILLQKGNKEEGCYHLGKAFQNGYGNIERILNFYCK